MDARENTLRAIRFETPEYIPTKFWINSGCWQVYGMDAIGELVESHQKLFNGLSVNDIYTAPADWEKANKPYTDMWGCTWKTSVDGLVGCIVEHPLGDWQNLETYKSPTPGSGNGLQKIQWHAVAEKFRKIRNNERSNYQIEPEGLRCGALEHGYGFLRAGYLRGYQNLIFDMADDDQRLNWLFEMIEKYNAAAVKKYIELGAEMMYYPEDLGMQTGPMLSPTHFKKYIKPMYKRLMKPAKNAECLVHVHSDGDLHAFTDDLINCGADIINLQDIVNGIDWIAANLKGKVCIDLDIDRQSVTHSGTPADIDALIRNEVETLGDKAGGLMLIYGWYPGVPIENARAVMDAMEKYSDYYC
jgi:hypothetical protein